MFWSPRGKGKTDHITARILTVLVFAIVLVGYPYLAVSQENDFTFAKREKARDLHPNLMHSAHKLLRSIENGEAIEKHLDEMMEQVDVIEAEGDEFESRFEEIEKKLPHFSRIIERHEQAVRKHRENSRRFKEIARELRTGRHRRESPLRIKQKAQDLIEFMEWHRTKKVKLLETENRLPWRVAEPGELLLLGDSSSIPQTGAPVSLTSPPLGNDLSPTADVQITPEIQQLANSLDNHPLKIFRYVYNNYDYTPYYGSVKGSLDTFWEKEGNDYDLSSLLIALLRASNIPARYVRVNMTLPIERIMKWLDFNDPKAALDYLSSSRIPSGYYTQGDKITHATIEHVYVEAYVPYANYRGTVQDDRGKLWIPMDPSFKAYKVTQEGIDIASEMGFHWQTFSDAYLDNLGNITPVKHYQKKTEKYLKTAHPGQTIDSLKRKTEISPMRFDILPGTLPYKVTQILGRFSEIPPELRHTLRLTIPNSLDFTATLPEISGRRLTLSFEAATSEDQAVIDQYEDIFETPPYLIEVKPVLRINGAKIKEGQPLSAGIEYPFLVEYHQTGQAMDIYQHNIMAGSINALGITTGKVRPEYLSISQVEESDERYLPKMLHSLAMKYHHNENETKKALNDTMKMRSKTYFAEVLVSTKETVKSTFGVPMTFDLSGYMIDAKEICVGVTPVDGYDKNKIMNFMMVRGLESSAQENRVFQDSMFWATGLSAVNGLQVLKAMKIPITELEPPLTYVNPNLHETVVEDINNALNMGWHVIVPESTGELSAIPYIKYDPNTGSGAYMLGLIAGGTSAYNEVSTDLLKLVRYDIDKSPDIKVEKTEFEIYDPEQGKAFIWGDKFYAKIKMKVMYKQGDVEKTKEFIEDASGNPFQMGIQTGSYIYDDTGDPIPWNNPGAYNITYDGKSIFNFYVWGPVLDEISSDRYLGISNENGVDTIKKPLKIFYSIKELEGVEITLPRMRIRKNESLVKIMSNLPVGDNQEVTWDGKDESGQIVIPGEYEITISAFGNDTDVETNPYKTIVLKMQVDTPCEALTPPYGCMDSFVAKRVLPGQTHRTEDRIIARIDSGESHIYPQITWTCDDYPEDGIDCHICDPRDGSGASFESVPHPNDSPDGRPGPLAYVLKATVMINEGAYELIQRIQQDDLDQLRQQYHDMGKNRQPERFEFVNDHNYQNPEGHFSFEEINCQGDITTWAIFWIQGVLENVRSDIGNQGMPVNSAYRTPMHNATPEVSGERESQHIYGFAADISARRDYNGDGMIDRADWDFLASAARNTRRACIEPYSPTRAGWVHMDWRPEGCPTGW